MVAGEGFYPTSRASSRGRMAPFFGVVGDDASPSIVVASSPIGVSGFVRRLVLPDEIRSTRYQAAIAKLPSHTRDSYLISC